MESDLDRDKNPDTSNILKDSNDFESAQDPNSLNSLDNLETIDSLDSLDSKKRRSLSYMGKKEKVFSFKEKRRSSCTDTEELLKPLNLTFSEVVLSPRINISLKLSNNTDSAGNSPLQTESPGTSPITTPRGSATPRGSGLTPRLTPRPILIKKFDIEPKTEPVVETTTGMKCNESSIQTRTQAIKLSVKQPSVPKLNIDLMNK